MPYFYLFSTVFLFATSSIFGKAFTRRNSECRGAETFYNFFMIFSVFVCWCVLFATSPSFSPVALIYSAIFGASFIIANVGLIYALKNGPATLTALFMNLSLILTTFWGFIFWGDELTSTVIIGLVLVVIAIVLCLYSGEKSDKSVNLKWLIFALTALLGNASCTITQRTYQDAYDGANGNMMMMFAIGFSALFYLIIYLKSDRSDTPVMIKRSWWIPVAAGISNMVQNLFVMFMALSDLSPSLIYPVIAVGGLAVVTVFSIFLFKERMRWWQWIGVAVGAASVALLSI